MNTMTWLVIPLLVTGCGPSSQREDASVDLFAEDAIPELARADAKADLSAVDANADLSAVDANPDLSAVDAVPDLARAEAGPDLTYTCGNCPACKVNEDCCGAGGACQFAPRCLERCNYDSDCGFSRCYYLYEGCGPNGILMGHCLPAPPTLCPGVPANPPQGANCGVCDALLGGANERCEGDVATSPVDRKELRLCGFTRRRCKNCRAAPPPNPGVACDP